MSDTVVADILDHLFDEIAANATIAAAVAAGSLRLFDGPPATDWAAMAMLSVGGRVREDDDDPPTDLDDDWSTMGTSGTTAQIAEWVAVPCAIAIRDGSAKVMRTLRRTAIGYYAAAAATARGTTLSIPQVMWCIPSLGSIRQMQSTSGCEVFISFSVRVRTQI